MGDMVGRGGGGNNVTVQEGWLGCECSVIEGSMKVK